MKFNKLIKSSKWKKVKQVFLENYPDQKESIIGYEDVYFKLKSIKHKPNKMEICCDLVKPLNSDTTEEPYHSIYGVNGKKKDNGELETYSLSLTPWSKWLGSSLSPKILHSYINEEIIAHCLFEITFYWVFRNDN